MTFNEAIVQIVKQNSGGVKLTTLVTEMLVVLHREKQIDDVQFDVSDTFLELLTDRLAELESVGKIGILKYSFPMGGDTVREKQFIYFS